VEAQEVAAVEARTARQLLGSERERPARICRGLEEERLDGAVASEPTVEISPLDQQEEPLPGSSARATVSAGREGRSASAVSARRWLLTLALTATGLLLAGVVVLYGRSSPPAPSTTVPADQPGFPALTWPPPPAWQQYAAAAVPTQGGTITLRSDTDYRLSASGTITGPVVIRGGRDVVWIGGHIRIDDQASAAPLGTARRGLVIADAPDGSSVDGRVVHLEGLLIDGDDLSEGIDPACPSAIVQLENVHVGLVHIRGADDRDGTGSYQHELHADVLQPFGGFRQLRVDGLTGSSNFQGIYHSVDLGTAYGRSWFRRVNLTAAKVPGEEVIEGRVIGHAGHRMYRANVDRLGQQRIDTGTFWVQHHPDSGWAGGRFHRGAYRDADAAGGPGGRREHPHGQRPSAARQSRPTGRRGRRASRGRRPRRFTTSRASVGCMAGSAAAVSTRAPASESSTGPPRPRPPALAPRCGSRGGTTGVKLHTTRTSSHPSACRRNAITDCSWSEASTQRKPSTSPSPRCSAGRSR
jgi:hypothetical protein